MFVVPKKGNMCLFQLLLVLLVSLLANLLSCWVAMLLAVLVLNRRFVSKHISILWIVIVHVKLLICDMLFVKIELLKNKFGFDEAFNYKEESDLNAALKRLLLFLWSNSLWLDLYS